MSSAARLSRQAAAAVLPVSHGSRVRGVVLVDLPHFEDTRGALTVAELSGRLPFQVARLFMVHDAPMGTVRGRHAHRTLHQFLIALRCSCMVLADDGENRQEFHLDRPSHGLYLPPMTWGVQYQFTPETVLLALASASYDAADYIHDYAEFQQLARHR